MRVLKFLILIILLSGCGPKIEPRPTSGPTSAAGRVVEKHSGKAIPYAEVRLVSQKKGATAMSNGTDKRVWADENGNFFIDFEAGADHIYMLSAKAEHYFDDNIGVSVKPGIKNDNVKLSLEAKGYIKFNVINEGVKDTIFYYVYGLFYPEIELYGFSQDTVVFRESTANKEQSISIRESTSIGFIYHTPKLIYIPALDTIEYTIKY